MIFLPKEDNINIIWTIKNAKNSLRIIIQLKNWKKLKKLEKIVLIR